MRALLIALALLLTWQAVCVDALYVVMSEGQQRCFYEEARAFYLYPANKQLHLSKDPRNAHEWPLFAISSLLRIALVPSHTTISGRFESSPLVNGHLLGSSADELPQGQIPPLVHAEEQARIVTSFNAKPYSMQVDVFDPQNQPVYSQVLDKSARFQFESGNGGEYKICFQTTIKAWYNPLKFKFTFELETGADARDYQNIAKKEHLTNLELEVRKLYDRTQNIIAELNYQKEREIAFRETSESTNSRATWSSVFQISIIALSTFIQIQYLKMFFRKKKLI